jgi:hypothetical protein
VSFEFGGRKSVFSLRILDFAAFVMVAVAKMPDPVDRINNIGIVYAPPLVVREGHPGRPQCDLGKVQLRCAQLGARHNQYALPPPLTSETALQRSVGGPEGSLAEVEGAWSL